MSRFLSACGDPLVLVSRKKLLVQKCGVIVDATLSADQPIAAAAISNHGRWLATITGEAFQWINIYTLRENNWDIVHCSRVPRADASVAWIETSGRYPPDHLLMQWSSGHPSIRFRPDADDKWIRT